MAHADGAGHRAELFFPFPSTTARAVHGALAPETTNAEVPKTASRVVLEPDGVRVALVAEDLSSLRAAVNSWLRWVDAAEKAARLGLALEKREDAKTRGREHDGPSAPGA